MNDDSASSVKIADGMRERQRGEREREKGRDRRVSRCCYRRVKEDEGGVG
jgi:hypothetical protein